MGTDNFHHKRKAKDLKSLQRKQKKRSPYDKVLIVCEGSKTEPNYFQEAIDFLRLNTANVEIDKKSGSSPCSVLKRARQLYKESCKNNDSYDKVFCVIDRDNHATYFSTVTTIDSLKPNNTFYAIKSVPCFEYWILLHFENTRAPFHATGNKSICECVISKLKKDYLPDYEKGEKGLFDNLFENIDTAIKNSQKALHEAKKDGEENPSTNIHELMIYLRELNQ